MSTLDVRDDRAALTDILRPPPGYVLGACIGTTYTLDFDALTAVLLAFAGAELGDSVQDSVSVLTTLARMRHRIRVFVDAAGIHAPADSNRLFALYDRIVTTVTAPHAAFHPKVWALRLDAVAQGRRAESPSIYRVLCASRNLANSRFWELSVSLEGRRDSGRQSFGAELAKFLRELSRMSSVPTELWRLISELPSVNFGERREWSQDLRLEWQWPRRRRLAEALPGRAGRALLISPFVRANYIGELSKRVDELTVVSTQRELDCLPETAHQQLAKARVYVVREAEIDGAPSYELHAKLLAWEDGEHRETLVGSANATGTGWGLGGASNIEAMTALRPGLKIDDVVRAFISPQKGVLYGWIDRYQRTSSEASPVEEAEEALKGIKRDLSHETLLGTYDFTSMALTIRRERQASAVIPPHVEAWVRPLMSTDKASWAAYAAVGGDGVRFRDVKLEDLSSFMLVRLRDTRFEDVELTFCTLCRLMLDDDVRDRRDAAVNVRLLEGLDARALLLNVLHGLPAGAGIRRAHSKVASHGLLATAGVPKASIERVLEACTADPGRIEEVDAILRATSGASEMDSFREFWGTFQQALTEVSRRG